MPVSIFLGPGQLAPLISFPQVLHWHRLSQNGNVGKCTSPQCPASYLLRALELAGGLGAGAFLTPSNCSGAVSGLTLPGCPLGRHLALFLPLALSCQMTLVSDLDTPLSDPRFFHSPRTPQTPLALISGDSVSF